MNHIFNQLTKDTDPRLVDKFLKYHRENPDLYELFKTYAESARVKGGRRRFSIWMIANRVRWYSQVETSGKEFKVSNDYLALYARLLISENPLFDGFFQMKRMKTMRSEARE